MDRRTCMMQTLSHLRPPFWSPAHHTNKLLSIFASSFPPQALHTCWSLNQECSFARMTSSYLNVSSSVMPSPTVSFNQIPSSLPQISSSFSVSPQPLCFLRNAYHSLFIFFVYCLSSLLNHELYEVSSHIPVIFLELSRVHGTLEIVNNCLSNEYMSLGGM